MAPQVVEAPKYFKVILVGEGGVGKSTYINRLLTGEFEKKYVPTMGVEVHPLTFRTTRGVIYLNVWDTAGQEKFSGPRDGYYIAADACIGMFDLTSKVTLEHLPGILREVKKVRGEIPMVVCGNKCDVQEVKVSLETRAKIAEKYRYFDISAKSNYQYEEPFLCLMRMLVRDDTLEIVPIPAVAPPEVRVDHGVASSEHERFELDVAEQSML